MPIDEEFRNPIIIPDSGHSKPHCPQCKGDNFSGRRIQGVVTFKCRNPECKNEWSGGLPQEPMDPRVPRAPEPLTPPPLTFSKNPKTGEVEESRRSVNLTQDFRRGELVPENEEEEV